MKKAQAIRHFGSQSEIARQCNLTRQAVQQWPETVPFGWQNWLHAKSGGKLRPQPFPPKRRQG
jgi:hypothetical protein